MAISFAQWVAFKDATFGLIPALVLSQSAGVANLAVYYPNGTTVHKLNISGAVAPGTNGMYVSDVFPNVPDGSITTSQISATAGILGSQLAAAAGIIGTQLGASAAIAGSQLASNAGIVGSQLAAGAAIIGSQLSVFQSTEQTGTGASQNIAHGLGRTPSLVWFYASDTTPVGIIAGGYTIVPGAHTSTNVVVTASNTMKFRAFAL